VTERPTKLTICLMHFDSTAAHLGIHSSGISV